jgi:hypothetical protein
LFLAILLTRAERYTLERILPRWWGGAHCECVRSSHAASAHHFEQAWFLARERTRLVARAGPASLARQRPRLLRNRTGASARSRVMATEPTAAARDGSLRQSDLLRVDRAHTSVSRMRVTGGLGASVPVGVAAESVKPPNPAKMKVPRELLLPWAFSRKGAPHFARRIGPPVPVRAPRTRTILTMAREMGLGRRESQCRGSRRYPSAGRRYSTLRTCPTWWPKRASRRTRSTRGTGRSASARGAAPPRGRRQGGPP